MPDGSFFLQNLFKICMYALGESKNINLKQKTLKYTSILHTFKLVEKCQKSRFWQIFSFCRIFQNLRFLKYCMAKKCPSTKLFGNFFKKSPEMFRINYKLIFKTGNWKKYIFFMHFQAGWKMTKIKFLTNFKFLPIFYKFEIFEILLG